MWMGRYIYHWQFVMIIFLIQISEIYSKVMSQVCGVNEVGCLLDEDCSSGLFCNTGLAQPRCSYKLFDGCWFQAFSSLELTKFWVNPLFAKVHNQLLCWRIADVRTSMNVMQITSTSTALSIAAITPLAGSNFTISSFTFAAFLIHKTNKLKTQSLNEIIWSNTVGSLSCSCTSGYVEWSAINGCRDKNECTEVATFFHSLIFLR